MSVARGIDEPIRSQEQARHDALPNRLITMSPFPGQSAFELMRDGGVEIIRLRKALRQCVEALRSSAGDHERMNAVRDGKSALLP